MATVDIKHFYDCINEVWKWLKQYEEVGTDKETWQNINGFINGIIAENDETKTIIYSAAHKLMQTAVMEELEK